MVKIMKNFYSRFGWDVFISYTHKDEGLVVKIVEQLKKRFQKNEITVYFDRLDQPLEHTNGLGAGLSEGLANCKLFLVFVSENYLTRSWCLAEANNFFRKYVPSIFKEGFGGLGYPGLTLNELIIPIIIENKKIKCELLLKRFRSMLIDNNPLAKRLKKSIKLPFDKFFIIKEEIDKRTINSVCDIIKKRLRKSEKVLKQVYEEDALMMSTITPKKAWHTAFSNYRNSCTWAINLNISKIIKSHKFTLDGECSENTAITTAENALVAIFDGISRRIPIMQVLNFIGREMWAFARSNPGQHKHSPGYGHFFYFDSEHPPAKNENPHAIENLDAITSEGNPFLLLMEFSKSANIIAELQESYYQFLRMRKRNLLVEASVLAAMVISDDTFMGDIYTYEIFEKNILEPLYKGEPISS